MRKIKLFLHKIIIYMMNFLSKILLPYFLFIKLNVHYRNWKIMYATRGPFVVLPNHTNQWDPMAVSWVTPRAIRWVTSDAAFRDGIKTLLTMGGAIPKLKEQSDMVTLQQLKEAKAMGLACGIFPEGAQNWDGRMLDLIPATAKLIRFLKLPVIVPLIKGGFITKPRYAWGSRRSRIDVEFTRIIDADEIQDMKLVEIERRINEALVQDDYEWQKTAKVQVHSETRAEHMELAHYLCPSCESVGSMISKGNILTCSCGYIIEVDQFGFFLYPEDGPSFDTPHHWLVWQNRHFVDGIIDTLDSADPGSDPVLLRDADITLMRGARATPMAAVLTGEARLYKDRIEVGPPGGEIITFPLRETSAANTFKQQKFEFRFDKAQYRFAMPSRSISGYKWEVAYKGLRQSLVERGEW